MLIYRFYNKYHLGDNIFNFILFYHIKNYIEENNIQIYYYCLPHYINQVSEFNCSENIIIQNIDEGMPENTIELWQNNDKLGVTFHATHSTCIQQKKKRVNYNLFYKVFFNNFLKMIKIPIKMKHFNYIDEDLLTRFINLPDKYKDIDLLILNSQPFSEQYVYNKNIWDGMINLYNKNYKLVTTTKVDGISCTADDNLSVKDIASISINVKVIIAINSGVVPGLLNEYTLTNVKQVYMFDDRCKFSYPNFQMKEDIREISFNELNKFIKLTK
jgi:hypothetical protein